MNILFVSETWHPTRSGVVVSIERLCTALQARGHETNIFAPSHDIWIHREKTPYGGLYRFPAWQLPNRKDVRLALPLQLTRRSVLRAVAPDVVHLHTPGSLPFRTKKMALRRNIPVVATHHFSLAFAQSYAMGHHIEWILIPYLNQFFAGCADVTCPTETVRKEWEEAGLKKPLTVVSNGLPEEAFLPCPTAIKPPDPTVLYVGRMDQDKNVEILLQAIPLILRHVPTARFLFVGDGNRLESCQKWAENQGLSRSIIFTGRLDSEAVHCLYNQTDLVWTASPIETQCLVGLEAFACNVPLVAANAGALPELVKDGVTGFLANPYAPEQFARHAIYLLTHPHHAQQMGEAGFALAQQHAMTVVLQKYEELYQRAIAKSRNS